jgi:hypothetical protein
MGSGRAEAFSRVIEADVLAKAYLPEHIPSLMAIISCGQPFLAGEYLGYTRDNWLILVGYPLQGSYSQESCEQAIHHSIETCQPEYLWFIGPEIPAMLSESCRARSSDVYYQLDLSRLQISSALRRQVKKASASLSVQKGENYTREHRALVGELLRRKELSPMVAELYRSMPTYLRASPSACLLEARRLDGKLCAFYVIEQAAQRFDAYVLGCYSQKRYIPHASDLLFLEMIELAKQNGKALINLGLGVNEGIKRFKEKWGGQPFLKYEFCEARFGSNNWAAWIDVLEGKL